MLAACLNETPWGKLQKKFFFGDRISWIHSLLWLTMGKLKGRGYRFQNLSGGPHRHATPQKSSVPIKVSAISLQWSGPTQKNPHPGEVIQIQSISLNGSSKRLWTPRISSPAPATPRKLAGLARQKPEEAPVQSNKLSCLFAIGLTDVAPESWGNSKSSWWHSLSSYR